MIPLHLSLEDYKEGYSVPSINWKVTFRLPPPSDDTDSGPDDINVSERLMNDPNIIDSADYRENLTYINEVNLKLNNEDGFLSNDAGTGKLDNAESVEVFIDGYFDIAGGDEHTIRKFGGWIDLDRNKADSVKMTLDVTAYSYLGKGERITGKTIVTKYYDDVGLILFNTGLRVTDAAVIDKNLKIGLHTIQTRINEDMDQAKLDDGAWVNLSAGEVSLYNMSETEQIKIFYDEELFIEDSESKIIQKTFGEKYPFVLYHNASLFSILENCFTEIGISESFIQPYEIKTYDNRKIFSYYDFPVNESFYSSVKCIGSNGEKKLFIGYKNEVWMRDMETQKYTFLFKSSDDFNTEARRIICTTGNIILTYFTFESGEFKYLYKFNIDTSEQTLLFDNEVTTYHTTSNIGNTLHYSSRLGKFIYNYIDNDFNKGITTLSQSGDYEIILTDSQIFNSGFSYLYETSSLTRFYYIKIISGVAKLYSIDYNFSLESWGSPTYRIDFYVSETGNIEASQGTAFYNESKIFIREYPSGDSVLYNVVGNSFNVDFNPSDYKLYSPVEFEGRLYFIIYKNSPHTLKIGYLESDDIIIESDNFNAIIPDIIGTDLYKTCITKNFKNEVVLNIAATKPNLIIRYSEWYNLFIPGEFDRTSETIRSIMTELANAYLGYVFIKPDKTAMFISRSEYDSADTIAFKKFNQARIRERVYSEKYDKVIIRNEHSEEFIGDNMLDPKELSLTFNTLSDDMLKDISKYFYDYYSTSRYLIKLNYLPTFYNWEVMDKADLSEFGLGTGRIHKVAPRKSICEFEILMEQ